MEDFILEKWKNLINACKSYYIDSIPTGMSDSVYDDLEKRAAIEDGFFVRDYVFDKYLKGVKTKNNFIEKIKKEKIIGSMFESLSNFEKEYGDTIYCDLKYDGSSLAIYINPKTGIPMRIVTVGNLNIENYGVDQTWKLINFIPRRFPKGIVAIQAEALVDINRLSDVDPERARQKANGLINSKYCDSEVNNLLTIRAYRYYTDDSNEGKYISSLDYRQVLNSFGVVKSNIDGHILFSPAHIWTIKELSENPSYCETDRTITPTGEFLNDGWVVYDKYGKCIKALKYSSAGAGELGKTVVKGIQWNSQVSKGKDSWSANIIIDPVTIKGCTIRKPSAGSVGKMIKNSITIGANVEIILANSTIPMVGKVYSPGDGNFMWPKCPCGYQMSDKDVYGSLLKCGNHLCTERINRMKDYLSKLTDIHKQLNLNQFLVIDRFKWENTDVSIDILLNLIELNDFEKYKNYLMSYMTTDLQKRNLDLVCDSSFIVLRECFEEWKKKVQN